MGRGKDGREHIMLRGVAANDDGGAEARIGAAVLTVARLLGRQIAGEAFERPDAANDNRPVSEAGERQER